VLFSLLPFAALQHANIIGASGAIYGLLLAYAIVLSGSADPAHNFPVPARIAVAILGAIALFSSLSDAGGVAKRRTWVDCSSPTSF